MNKLKTGDVLIYTPDNSKRRFLHYKPANPREGYVTVSANYQGDDHPRQNKELVCVQRWDDQKNDWDYDSHDTLPASNFKLAD